MRNAGGGWVGGIQLQIVQEILMNQLVPEIIRNQLVPVIIMNQLVPEIIMNPRILTTANYSP
jgi:hypothetical protein